MQDFEKLGAFYLGRPFDLAARKPAGEGEVLLYDAKDLTTHAVIVGMTGSGKTGLGIALLEEAAIDGIPSIVIDPKGDLGNLLLTFPDLRAEDFAPWVSEEDARSQGISPEDLGKRQADLWRSGLASWGEDGARVERLRNAAEFTLFTPGSTAGVPVSVLRTFGAPDQATRDDPDSLRERIAGTASSLLGLLGIEADPVRSREHILLATILGTHWKAGRDLDLPALIREVQDPPFAQVGVLDLESFYPKKDRFALAMALNNLLAAPGFGAWMEGEPLDPGALLHTPAGKPRVSIFSIAHLSDAERMFFVSLLLSSVLGWVRTQPGTSSLRAILYMDEIFGFFPPVANPPSKPPLLTLLKQARAFGLGVVLATQNPVDLDYKGLANTGTWFIGRLQTERDKQRLLEGLEGAAATTVAGFDRQKIEETLAGLGKRIFLMHDVHEDGPVVFETRWTLSYLRGPITRQEIRRIVGPPPAPPPPAPSVAPPAGTGSRPGVPRGIQEHFVPPRAPIPPGSRLVMVPMVLGIARIHHGPASEEVALLSPIPPDWAQSTPLADPRPGSPPPDAEYAPLPAGWSFETWGREFAAWIVAHRPVQLYRSERIGEVSHPGESERDFRLRLVQRSREIRDAALEKLRQKYAPRLSVLQERLRRAEEAVSREKSQVTQQGVQTAISVGATLLGALLGRRAVSTSTLGRATTAARGMGRTMREQQDVARAREAADKARQELAELDAEFRAETEAIQSRIDPQIEDIEPCPIPARKQDVEVRLLALAWTPHLRDEEGRLQPALPGT